MATGRAFGNTEIQPLPNHYPVHGLIITVCHCPPGASKWNPVEHRLFSFISLDWAGLPLRSLQLMMSYIGGRPIEAEPCRPVPNGVVFAR